MKTLSTRLVRNVFAVFIALGLGYMAYTINPGTSAVPNVNAGTGQRVSGFAWSKGTGAGTYQITGTADPVGGPYTAGSNPGVGWISLNSSDCDTDKNGKTDSGACGGNNATSTAFDYGVDINPIATTGIGSFSGSAWSPNDPDLSGNPTGQGWISFNRGVTGSPLSAWGDPGASQTGTPLAYVDWTTGKVYGWARAIVACRGVTINYWNGAMCTSSSAGDSAGNWDGWIKLSDASWANGVIINTSTGKFSGLAWGGEVMGWIDFAPTIGGVPISNLAKVAIPVACTASDPTTYTFTGTTCNATCVSGGGTTQTVTGTQYAQCLDGSGVSGNSQSCTTTITCTATSGVWIKGDGVCSASAGETFQNSPSDCKIKTNFYQF